MDDFGTYYQTEVWAMTETAYGHSMATFGMLDDVASMICIQYSADYAAQEI